MGAKGCHLKDIHPGCCTEPSYLQPSVGSEVKYLMTSENSAPKKLPRLSAATLRDIIFACVFPG